MIKSFYLFTTGTLLHFSSTTQMLIYILIDYFVDYTQLDVQTVNVFKLASITVLAFRIKWSRCNSTRSAIALTIYVGLFVYFLTVATTCLSPALPVTWGK